MWRPASEDDHYIELEKREFLSTSMNDETLNAGWNHFTEEIPAKWKLVVSLILGVCE